MTARVEGTEEEVANMALGHLRQEPIATLNDNNARARAVKNNFAMARDAALRLRWWNFATTYDTLSKNTSVTLLGKLTGAFPLPGDCLAVRFVQDAEPDQWELMVAKADPAGSDARIKVLATNILVPTICYTRSVPEAYLWDADFKIALSYQLAALSGGKLGASSTRIEKLQGMADAWQADATEIDAQEKAPSQVSRDTSWVASRRRGGSVTRR